VIQGVKNYIRCSPRPTIVHVVRKVVEMKEIIHEIAAYPQLRIASIGIAHRSEKSSLKTMECLPLLLTQVISKKPLLGFSRRLFAMSIYLDVECTVRDEIWDDNFG
jgi:hypothetical protein